MYIDSNNIQHFLIDDKENSKEKEVNGVGYQNAGKSKRTGLICLIVILYSYALTLETRRHVQTWENDLTILNACIVADPTDYECHEYLGQYYGHHLQMEDQAKNHLETALLYFPRSPTDFKSTLIRAHLMLILKKEKEACDIIENSYLYILSLYSDFDSDSDSDFDRNFRGSKSPIPLIMNNYVFCQLVNNLNLKQMKLMIPILQTAYKIVNHDKKGEGNVHNNYSEEDRRSIAENLRQTKEWQPGREYNAIFMW